MPSSSPSHLLDREGVDYETHPETGCWLWLKGKNGAGYPHGYAHRRYWEAVNGPRPDGYHIHHKCRTPACVNPDHLEAVSPTTHLEEHALGDRKGLCLNDYRRIRELIAECELSYLEIGNMYGIDQETVYDVARAKHWPELGGPVVFKPKKCKDPQCPKMLPAQRKHDRKFCSPTCRTRYNARKPERRAKATAYQRERRQALREAA